ncbi:MAG: CHAT domain-containing tetratricopeptide repeat protein [Steroidobacteraceae bacterium]
MLLAGCQAGVSPVEPILSFATVEIGNQDHQTIAIESPSKSPILVTVSSRDVDVRAALVNADGTIGAFADAPNRRMGIETLLLEAPHENTFSIRIERNDYAQARGTVAVDAAALPIANEADQRRLDAARLEAKASLQFSGPSQGVEAAGAFAAAARLYKTNGDDRSAGIALLHAAGARYLRLSDWQGTADLAQWAGRALDEGDAPEFSAFALRVEGAALDQLADTLDESGVREEIVASARKKLSKAAERFSKLGMPYEAGYALNYRGVSYQNGGERNLARADFEQALGLFRKVGDRPAQALSLQSLATLSHEEGRLADAMREFDAALAFIPREENLENYAHTLHNSARPLQVLGRFDEAIARYYEAGQILHQLGDRDGEARALHGMGISLRYAGEPERAKNFLIAAIDLRGATGSRREQAFSLSALGQIERDEGHIAKAIAIHREAAAQVNVPNDRAVTLHALAQDLAAAGVLEAGRRVLDEMLALDLPRTHRYIGLAQLELGALESLEGNAKASDEAFARALAVHKANGSELEQARTLYRRAEAKLRINDTRAALADTANALRLFDDVSLQGTQAEGRAAFRTTYRGAVELRISAFLAEAEVAQRNGDALLAQRNLRQAFSASDRARAQLLTDARALAFNARNAAPELLARRNEIYELLAGKRQRQERLLDATVPDSTQLASLSKDIALLRAEATLLESRLAKSQASPGGSKAPDADALIDAAPRIQQLAEYFLGNEHSWLFEIRDGVVTVHNLPDHGEIESLARQLHVAWRSPAKAKGNRAAISHQLAASIFGPLTKPIPGETLLVIPDGALHLVPMALLARQTWPEMQPGSAIVIPSLSATRAVPHGQDSTAGKSLAVVADPIYAPSDSRIRLALRQPAATGAAPVTRSTRDLNSLQRLPATAVEASDLLALMSKPSETLALIGPDASRERVTSAHLDQYRIVHFATHALADSQDPALATLALSRYDVDGKSINGALRLYDITQLHLNADLVVLSGCDTALGREIAGEGPIGLSQAFLRSGAQTVVSTLWQVPDTSTAALMREFYRQLLTNQRDAPVALQLAQDYLRRQPRWSDPYYWAGFQLISKARFNRKDKV